MNFLKSRAKTLAGGNAASSSGGGRDCRCCRARFPDGVEGAGPISMRFQSTWPAKDIFHEYALDFAKKVNDMTGGA